MAFIDYYKILGVDKNIPQKDVRAAYRSACQTVSSRSSPQ